MGNVGSLACFPNARHAKIGLNGTHFLTICQSDIKIFKFLKNQITCEEDHLGSFSKSEIYFKVQIRLFICFAQIQPFNF